MTKQNKIKEIKNKLADLWDHEITIVLYDCESVPFKELTLKVLEENFGSNINFSGMGREVCFDIYVGHEEFYQEFLSWLEEQPEEMIDKIFKEIDEKLKEED